MKRKLKYSLLAIAAIVILCGFTYSSREGNEFYSNKEQMETLYYRGHSYICYKWRNGNNAASVGGASIVHDPDCKCGKGGGK